jgi:predicted kinase
MLVGLVGSGKTGLANALESTGKWVRASQDDAPNRRRQEAEAMTRKALRGGHNAVIDRVNFDRK